MARMPLNEAGDRLTFSPVEAAALLGVGKPLVYEALRTGALPAVKLGRRTLITRDALAAYVRSLPAYGANHA